MSDDAIIKGYLRLHVKLNEVHRELRELLRVLTTPVKLASNERLILRALPAHLIKTYFTLEHLGTATAGDVAAATGKQRAVESHYLCQLALMGFVQKQRVSRRVVYICTSPKDKWQSENETK